MFRHKHPAFKALRDTVAFVVFALRWNGTSPTRTAQKPLRLSAPYGQRSLLLFLWCLAGLLGRCRPSAACVRPLQCHGHGLAGKLASCKCNGTQTLLSAGLCGLHLHRHCFALLRVMPQTVVYTFCIIASVVSFLFLRVFSKPINSTYAWVSVAGHSFQLTEALKLILVIGFSAAVTNDAWNEGVRFRAALLLLAVYAGGFFVLNELGTLLVCLLDCGVMALLYCSIKRTLSLVAFGALTGGVGYAFF